MFCITTTQKLQYRISTFIRIIFQVPCCWFNLKWRLSKTVQEIRDMFPDNLHSPSASNIPHSENSQLTFAAGSCGSMLLKQEAQEQLSGLHLLPDMTVNPFSIQYVPVTELPSVWLDKWVRGRVCARVCMLHKGGVILKHTVSVCFEQLLFLTRWAVRRANLPAQRGFVIHFCHNIARVSASVALVVYVWARRTNDPDNYRFLPADSDWLEGRGCMPSPSSMIKPRGRIQTAQTTERQREGWGLPTFSVSINLLHLRPRQRGALCCL